MKNTVILAATRRGLALAESIQQGLEGSEIYAYQSGIKKALEEVWHRCDGIVCVMAAGIVVRCIAGLCRSKFNDPGVVVVDEGGNFAISLLSGHIGGGNRLAHEVAAACGAAPVITTASDVSGHTAVDLWTVAENLAIRNPDRLPVIASRLLDRGRLKVYQQSVFIKNLPVDFKPCTNPEDADIVIALNWSEERDRLVVVPRINYIGMGCRRGAGLDEFETALTDLGRIHGLDLHSVAGLSSIDIKKDEAALLEFAAQHNWPLRFFDSASIDAVPVPSRSEMVHHHIGVYGVCEAAAVLAASSGNEAGRLIINKKKWQRITAAVAQRVY
jgi:cobalt-precorrin 5A hydrolase